ncbi:MAG: sensor histidine kinase [Verrucomicrobia bacterium]|nr:sensor histidine kinase [Verrucomicrobiota bacterium]
MAPESLLSLLAAYLNREREPLGRLWLTAVRRSPDLPSAALLSDAELTDHLPKVFDDLTRYLRERDGQGPRSETMRAAREHGGQRGRQGYHPGEVLRELGMLQRIVVLEGLVGFLQENGLADQGIGPARNLISQFFEDVAVASTERFVEEWAAQLEAANQRLAAVDASRLQLLRAVTHELGGLLQALNLGVTMARQASTDADRQQMFVLCERNLADMAALVEELRDYGVLLRGELHPEWATFDPRSFAEEVAATLHLQAQGEGVTLSVHVDPALSEVRSDRRRLREVVRNLVSNAIKYRDYAKPERWVKLAFIRSGPGHWSTIVEDNGVGIAPENLELIFAEFGRVMPSQGVQGTGLGLTISKRLTEMLGGEIRVQSQLTQGSRFEVVLPTTPDPSPRENP